MVVPPPPFVDHYEVLGSDRNGAPCTPSTPIAELRRAYFDRLRAYHPDKRQTSINGLGHKVTQALNEAWSILQDPDKKQAYDVIWRREKGSAGEKPAREFNLPPKVPVAATDAPPPSHLRIVGRSRRHSHGPHRLHRPHRQRHNDLMSHRANPASHRANAARIADLPMAREPIQDCPSRSAPRRSGRKATSSTKLRRWR